MLLSQAFGDAADHDLLPCTSLILEHFWLMRSRAVIPWFMPNHLSVSQGIISDDGRASTDLRGVHLRGKANPSLITVTTGQDQAVEGCEKEIQRDLCNYKADSQAQASTYVRSSHNHPPALSLLKQD